MTKEKATRKPRKGYGGPIHSIPQTDENFIVIPNDLGVAPYDTVLVLQGDGITKTDSGLYIPDTAIEKPPSGIVIMVGDRTDGKPSQFEQGDEVLFGEEAGREINVKGTVYLLIKHRDILWNLKH